MLEAKIQLSLLPADLELIAQIGRRARDIGVFLSPDEPLAARYLENLLIRLVTPILSDAGVVSATKVEIVSRLQREIGEASIIICPVETKLRILAYLLPLVGANPKETELLRRLLFPRKIAD